MKKILLPLVLVAGLGLSAPDASAESFQLAEVSTTSTTTNIEMPDVNMPDVTPDTNVTEHTVSESIHIDADNNDADTAASLSGTYILVFALIGIALIAVLAAVATRRSTI